MLFPIYTPAGKPAPTFQFCAASHDLPANQNPQSVNLSWGPEPAAGQTRHLIIGYSLPVASGVMPSGVTVGGVAATPVVRQANPGPAVGPSTGLWIVEKPTGTSGTVAVSVSSSDIDGGAIAVWAAYNLASATATDTASDNAITAGISNLSVDTLAGGAVFAAAGVVTAGAITAFTWVGVTGVSMDEDANDWTWFGSALSGVVAATPRTVQASFVLSATQRRIFSCAASFR